MIKIELESGREVTVDSFTFSGTYSGVLEGGPNPELNKRLLDQNCPRDWGQRKVLVVQPSDEAIESVLPGTVYKVWLNSDPINSAYMGSELVVIWFDNNPDDISIKEIIEKGIKKVDWDNHAEDWYL